MTDSYDPPFNHHTSRAQATSSSPLDEDRLASMADEGGVSGALMEIDDTSERRRLIAKQRPTMTSGRWRTAMAAFALVGIAMIAWRWLKRSA